MFLSKPKFECLGRSKQHSDTRKEFVMNWSQFGNTEFPALQVLIMLHIDGHQ